MRIVLFQYGDFGEVYRRLRAGGPETYRDQLHSVDFVASLAPRHEVTSVALCRRPHDEELGPGLRSIGIPCDLAHDRRRIWPVLDRLAPEALICRTPNRAVLRWAARKRVHTLPSFADIFTSGGLRTRLRNWRLARALRRCLRPCVANHSLSASMSLARLGLGPEEIVPWEFCRVRPEGEAKAAPPPDRPFRLLFAGALSESKGVGDCIEGVSIANEAGVDLELTLAGPGDVDAWAELASRRGVGSAVRLLGVIPAEQVLAEMRTSDAVVVASRHEYSEGLPNTIFEALASRSPLIASDHPAFVDRLRPDVDSLRFRAADPRDLARQVVRLIREPQLYGRLSEASAEALEGLYVGLEWSELVLRFLADPLDEGGWVRAHSLAALSESGGPFGPVLQGRGQAAPGLVKPVASDRVPSGIDGDGLPPSRQGPSISEGREDVPEGLVGAVSRMERE